MKKIMILAATVMMSLPSFAQATRELHRDAIDTADMLLSNSIRVCIGQVEKDQGANLVVLKILKTEVNDSSLYEIQGVLLEDGDIAKGYVSLEVNRSFDQVSGFYSYTCKVK